MPSLAHGCHEATVRSRHPKLKEYLRMAAAKKTAAKKSTKAAAGKKTAKKS